jgi:hypothetical protein
MKNYTQDEKMMLLNAMDHYIDAIDHGRNMLGPDEKHELTQKLWEVQELRGKLILDIKPITIKSLSPSNADYIRCCLCGRTDVLNYPEKRGIIPGFGNICNKCFEQHTPELYKKACRETQKERAEVENYYRQEYSENFNPDGTFKLRTFENPVKSGFPL